jgi:hypothetical protein
MGKVPPALIQGAKVKDVEPGEYGYIDPKDIWVDRDRRAYIDPDAPIHMRDNAVKFYRYTLHYQVHLDDSMSFQPREKVPSNFIPVEID